MPMLPDVMNLGLQTHGDPRASIAAVAVASTIEWLMHHDPNHHCLCALIDRTLFDIEIMESRYRPFRQDDDEISGHLRTAFTFMKDPKMLRECVGTGCFSLESVPFAIATFHRNPLDFRAGVLEAVNAGGDTDTTAAMVGAMIGAHVGIEGIPKEWLDAVPDTRKAIEIADSLCAVAGGGTAPPLQ